MTTFLLILSAMLGTLTQANGFTSNINRCIEWSEVLSAFNQSALDSQRLESVIAQELAGFDACLEAQQLDATTDEPMYSEEELHSEFLMEVSSWYCLGKDEWDFSRRGDNLPQEIITFYTNKKELTHHEQLLLDQMIDHVKFLEFNALCDSVKVYATTDEEFFAWQDAREQERLDQIMEQPVEHVEDDPYYFIDKESWAACYEAHLAALDKEAEAAHDQHMEAKVWEHHAWQNLVDEVIDAILMEDDYQYMKEWNEFTKDWSKTDSSDAFRPNEQEYHTSSIDSGSEGYETNIKDWLITDICKLANCTDDEFVQDLWLLRAVELNELLDQYRQALNERAMLEDSLAQQAQWQLDWDEYSEEAAINQMKEMEADCANYQLELEEAQMEHALGEVLVQEKLDLLKFMIEWQQCHLVTCEELELTKQEYEESLVEYEDWTDWNSEDTEEDWAFFHSNVDDLPPNPLWAEEDYDYELNRKHISC